MWGCGWVFGPSAWLVRACCAGMPTAGGHGLSTGVAGAHGLDSMLNVRASDPPTVVIWHERGGVGHDIGFMYKPIVETLSAGFRRVPDDVRKATRGQPLVVVGQGLHMELHRTIGGLNPLADFVAKGPGRAAPIPGPSRLRPGDVFVWIGPFGAWEVPWLRLRSEGVRTIFYQSEPADACAISATGDLELPGLGHKLQPNEIWDYSWHNIDFCRPASGSNITLRFVPPGYVDAAISADAESGTRPASAVADLIFLGYPFFKSGRRLSYGKLKHVLGDRLNATFSVWNTDSFNRWWRHSGQWAMHVNLHKRCCAALHEPLETFRIASLLSVGATVLSELAYPKDQAHFDGLVHFAPVDKMPAMMRTIQTLDQLHPSGPAVAWRERQQHVIARFRERFSPEAILQAAGAYSLLQSSEVRMAAAQVVASGARTLLEPKSIVTKSVRVETQPSFIFEYNPRDLDMNSLQTYGMLEPVLTWAFHEQAWRCCKRNGLVIDIGGNYGWYTLYARALGCRVSVFEPVPAYGAIIRKGLAANPSFLSGVELHTNVVYDSKGEYTLNVPRPERSTQHGMTGMSGRIGLLKGYPTSETIAVNASSISIDDVVPTGREVCLLKADIEGYEAHALASASRLLSGGTVRSLMLELTRGGHPDQRRRMGADNVAMLKGLVTLGYVVRQVPNSIYLENASLPRRVADWRRSGPWESLPPFPSLRTRAEAEKTGVDAMELAYTMDFTTHSTNLIARLRHRDVHRALYRSKSGGTV